ncbi:flagellar biosynthesis anti-sigma factor FlgM [Clostridium gasigenes]|uniref:flagellar biosynthesis anti-sigma factor FlgM n=1 Tax=Clostridium gasigenes TaxID=94869 RepID=UPI0014385811|nr:flagellar biosynthesis anti-sigma factor FlgM [Clostridium gasigenes]NKF06921.1 flagellar biosynthesis anti-sigma factor FlgM [Clostridium gasigenes]QSW19815.1 flagellar biosynthesis anti-sigma factor FlgM [Clostridium gasigenes]
MNIKGMGPLSTVNYYNKVASNKIEKIDKVKTSDRIELSEAGKVLNDYAVETSSYDKAAKVEEIKNKILNGTYNIDAKLTAKSMLDVMKEIK